jgi:hypothetical protein
MGDCGLMAFYRGRVTAFLVREVKWMAKDLLALWPKLAARSRPGLCSGQAAYSAALTAD